MSLAQRIYPKNPIYEAFGQRLVEELRNPQPGTAEPIMIFGSAGAVNSNPFVRHLERVGPTDAVGALGDCFGSLPRGERQQFRVSASGRSGADA